MCLAQLAPGVQTLAADRYEIIVTDDGATMTAEAIVRKRFPWVRWTAGPRRGPAANRNHGASIARGSWLAFTDDDCLPTSGWLAALAAAITTEDSVVLEGQTTCKAGVRPLLEEAPINLHGGNMWACNMALSREIFERSGKFDGRFPTANAEDLELHDRLRRAGIIVQFVPDAVVDHPPRQRRRGVPAGLLWEGRALLKVLDPNTLSGSMPLHVMKVRMSQMLSAGLSIAWVSFGWSSLIEVATVLFLHRRWLRQYEGAKPIKGSLIRD